jgi:hypothetical protein
MGFARAGLAAGTSIRDRSPRSVTPRRRLPRQCDDFCCLHFVVEDDALSAMCYFERSLDLDVITLGPGRGLLSINDHAAAPAETCQIECHLFAAAT